MNAKALVKRVAEELERRGFEMEERCYGRMYTSKQEYINGHRYFEIEEIYRNNATEENVTAKIIVTETIEVIDDYRCRIKQLGEIRVPKNASDKVIANRVNKAMEIYNAR